MNLSEINNAMRHLAAICAVVLCCLTMQAQNKCFTLKGRNVNVRKAPATGSVIGKVSAPYTFRSTEKDGWVEVWYNRQKGYISSQFVEEVELTEFSRRHLGSYMGESHAYDSGYSLAELEENDGFVVLSITDYSDVQDHGMRAHMGWVYAGLPEKNGVRLTHLLYPYYSGVPIAEQMTDDKRIDEYVFVVGKDGTLYSEDRTLGPQDVDTTAKDLPITERSLFMLRGNVSSVRYLRAYPETFLKDTEAPISNFSHTYSFSRRGDLTSVVMRNSEGEKWAEYTFTCQGDKVKMNGTCYSNSVSAEYVRDISNFEISYSDGSWQRSDGSAGGASTFYGFNMNGSMIRQGFDAECLPPFVEYSDGGGAHTYRYDKDPMCPTHIDIEFDYGGDGWYYSADIRDVKTDGQGNWTERSAYVDGKLMFMERRIITYYDAPQTGGTSDAGQTDDNSIYATVEQMPEYPGGLGALMTFIARNLRYPTLCEENKIQGRVVLKFVVEKDGSIGDITTVSSPHALLEKEAKRIVGMMPKWKPGRQKGRPVRVYYSLPVTFKLN